jgi:hypothetical protein
MQLQFPSKFKRFLVSLPPEFKNKYGRTPLVRINLDGMPLERVENPEYCVF